MAKSERKSWDRVRAIGNALVLSLPHHQTEARELAFEVQNIAKDMLYQLARGVHENPPADTVLGKRFSDRVYTIMYQHRDDRLDYKHDFKPGVQLWKANIGGQDAVIIIGAQGQAITEEF